MPIITATKATRTLIAATTSVAAGTPLTGTVWGDGTGGSTGALGSSPAGGAIIGSITNPGSGLTGGATVTVNVLVGGTVAASPVWKPLPNGSVSYPNTASANYPFGFDLPPGCAGAQIVVSGNTGAAVTAEAYGLELTNYVST